MSKSKSRSRTTNDVSKNKPSLYPLRKCETFETLRHVALLLDQKMEFP